MKKLYQSKTVWVNMGLAGLSWLLNHQGIMQLAGLDADTQILIVAAINIILRRVTKTAIG